MRSLDLDVEKTESGRWRVAAPWLEEPVVADTFEQGYWEAVSRHPRGR